MAWDKFLQWLLDGPPDPAPPNDQGFQDACPQPVLLIADGIWGMYTYIYIYMVAPPPGTYLFQFYTLFTVFKASPVKGFEGTGIPYSL